MAISYFPLTINVSQIVGKAVTNAVLTIGTNLPAGTPIAFGDEIAVPGGLYRLPGGVGSVNLPTKTGATNVSDWQYVVTGEYQLDGVVKRLAPVYIDAPTATTARNLASFVGVTSAPATFMGAAVAQLQAKVDEANAAADRANAAADIETTDDAVDTALNLPASKSATTVAALVEAQVAAEYTPKAHTSVNLADFATQANPLQAAVNYVLARGGRGEIYATAGTYPRTTSLSLPASAEITLRGDGPDATIFDCAGSAFVSTNTTPVAATTMTGTTLAGSRVFTVASAASIQVGQLAVVQSTQNMPETSRVIPRTHTGIVASVTGTTVTLDRETPIDFVAAGYTVTFNTHTVGRLTFRDFGIVVDAGANRYTMDLINAVGPRVERVSIRKRTKVYEGPLDANHPDGVRVMYSVDATISQCEWHHLRYGVFPTLGSVGTTVGGCTAYRCRHNVAPTGGSQDFLGFDLRSYACYAGLDSHQTAYGSTFRDCIDRGSEVAAKFRGRADRIENCKFYGGAGIELEHDPGLNTLVDKSGLLKTVSGSHIEGGVKGSSWSRDIRDTYIKGLLSTYRPAVGGTLVVERVTVDARDVARAAHATDGLWLHYYQRTTIRDVEFLGPYAGTAQTGVAEDATPTRALFITTPPTSSPGFVEVTNVTADGFDQGLRLQLGGDYSQFRFTDLRLVNCRSGVSQQGNNKVPAPTFDGLRFVGCGTDVVDPTRLVGAPIASGRAEQYDRVRAMAYGDGVPTLGTWKQGDRVYNRAPVAAGVEGWVCVVAGTPGTWKPFGTIGA